MADDLARLRRRWYARLKAEGFDDLEHDGRDVDPEIRAKGHIDPDLLRSGHYDAVAEYYRVAGQHLHHHKWRSRRDREIWRMHVDGVCYTRIAKRVHVYRRYVFETVKRCQADMLGLTKRPGRPRNPGGFDNETSKVVTLRVNEEMQLILAVAQERLKLSTAQLVRMAILNLAKHLK